MGNKEDGLSQGRDKNEGKVVGRYIQSPPLFFGRDGHNIPICDIYRGSSVFLILSGPSIHDINLDKLNSPGIMTAGVNNSTKIHRPNIWIGCDKPTQFLPSVWLDPTIQKFYPLTKKEDKFLRVNDIDMHVGDCPNVIYFRRNFSFNSETFMYEDTFNFGRSKENGGGRSVMLPAIRILYSLGFRNIFLLGCDFNMKVENPYSFEESVGDDYVSANMSTYMKLSQWFTELKPHFDKMGLQVFNCNKNSNLNVFPFVDFDEAYDAVTSMIPSPDKENTKGMYRKTKTKTSVSKPIEVEVSRIDAKEEDKRKSFNELIIEQEKKKVYGEDFKEDEVRTRDLNPNNKGKFTEEELEFIRTVEDSALERPSVAVLKKIRLEQIAERMKKRKMDKVKGIALKDKDRLDPLVDIENDSEDPEERGKRILEEYLKRNEK